MPRKTEYQKQADKRTKDALRLRAKSDGRIRKNALALLTALDGSLNAKNRIDRINLLYGVDISPETMLARAVRVLDVGVQLGVLTTETTPGDEIQLFNPTPDSSVNGGVLLALEEVFGEVSNTPPVVPPSGNEM